MNRLCLTSLAVVLVACGGQAEPFVSLSEQREAIRDGTASVDPAVVALVARRKSCDGPPPELRCTGTLIAARWVLTAAHCVRGARRGELEVFFGTKPGEPGGMYRGIAASVGHPKYERQLDDNDVALLWLTEPGPVAPVPLSDRPLDSSWLGQTARVAGFGSATSDTGANLATKQQGTVRLSELGEHTLSYGPAPSMTCPGDSGGPIFVAREGTEMLIGLTTSGDAACAEWGVGARVDVQLSSFIEPVLASASSRTAALSPEEICLGPCRDDQDCPADLACRADVDGTNRCLLPGVAAGDLLAGCQSDGECSGGRCVPWGDGCRCSQPCAASVMDQRSDSNHGCQMAPVPSCGWSSGLAMGLGLVRLAWLRNRRRRRLRP